MEEDTELIIIDNKNSEYTNNSDKITIIKPNKNLYVNPSWNLGVSIAKGDYICLLNDDIIFNIKTLKKGLDQLLLIDSNFGIFASHILEGWNKRLAMNKDDDQITIKELDVRVWGFGMLMLMKKENYYMIPPEFKVFFGDDFLHAINTDLLGKKSYWADGMSYSGQFSASSSEEEIGKDYMIKEAAIWPEVIEREFNKLKHSPLKAL